MGRALALGRSMNAFAADLKLRNHPPGETWQYVSIDTHVVGMVLEGATGRPVAELLSEKIVAPMGLEAAPYYITDGQGTAFVLGGLNLRTRDYARFGQMVLQDGIWNGTRIVPADWIALSTAASAPTAPGAEGYGYQWWIPADARPGEVFARGIYGQYVWIDRATRTVIAVNSADRNFEEPGTHQAMLAMFRRIADDRP
jgi:CubicO group peptidase (beta-lactamase class C family)